MLRPPILSLRRAASSLRSSTYVSRPPVLAASFFARPPRFGLATQLFPGEP